MTGKGFSLDDYVTVSERVEAFYKKHPQGSLQAEIVELSDNRVVVRAYAYRDAEDAKPAIAHSMLGIPGATPYTRGSEIENAETSAIGRAIAFLGFDVKKGIATRDEVRNKQDEASAQRPAVHSLRGGAPASEGPWAGPVSKGRNPVDGNLRQSPDGSTFGFVITEPIPGSETGRRVQVLAVGPLGDALALACADGLPKEATVWGELVMVPWQKDGKDMPPYRRVIASKVSTPDFTVPAAPEPSTGGWGGLSPEDEAAIWGGDAA